MSIEVYDNFLPEEVFTPIRDYVFGGRMPWYYMPNSVRKEDNCPQFSHMCYANCVPISDVFEKIKPIFCLLYTSPSPRDRQKSRMPSSA